MILSEILSIVLLPTILKDNSTGPENRTLAYRTSVHRIHKNSTLLDILPENLLKEIESGENAGNTNGNVSDIEEVLQIIESDKNNSPPGNNTENSINNDEEILSRSGFRWFWPSSTSSQKVQVTTVKPMELECSPVQTEYMGQCHNVLQQRPCPTGQWLVEDEILTRGRCVENKCKDSPDTAFYEGKCIRVRSEEPCPSGMRTYLFKSGKVECDCKDGFIYNEKDGKCYEAYRQGPCQPKEYFAIPKRPRFQIGFAKPTCMPNPCSLDGYFCNAPSCPSKKRRNDKRIYSTGLPADCVQFGSPCTKDGRGVFVIHPDTNTPFCQEDIGDIHPARRIIGNVPTLKCAPGSRRDILGNCRTPSDIEFS